MQATLHVAGFSSHLRARDLAYEFERFGPLIRCDIPAPKSHKAVPFAFVEFEDPRDAEEAHSDMHNRHIDGYRISVQWAKNAPSPHWRFDRSPPPPRRYRSPSPGYRHHGYGRSRSRSPYGRYHRGPPPPPHHHHHHAPPPPHHYGPPRGRSPPPPHMYARRPASSRSRSPLPPPRDDEHAYNSRPMSNTRRSSRSPSPPPVRASSRSPSAHRSISPRRSPSPEN
ncbi:hypothetical protein BC940DRAFT_350071 [Gongronella butleri]|nr:hypothetical protein BC940DRAFT_350071 [Gongronella butleri]